MGTYRHNAEFLAGIAQLVEHLTCNQGVPSSTLGAGTSLSLKVPQGISVSRYSSVGRAPDL